MENLFYYVKEEPLDLYNDDDGTEKQELSANQDAELDYMIEDFEIVEEQPDIIDQQYCSLYSETVEQCEKHEYREHMVRNRSCSICCSQLCSLDALIHYQQHGHGKMQRYVCSHCRLMDNVVPHTYTSKEIVGQYKPKGTSPLTSSAPLAKPSLEICDTDKRVMPEMDDSNDGIRIKEEPLDDYQHITMDPIELNFKMEDAEVPDIIDKITPMKKSADDPPSIFLTLGDGSDAELMKMREVHHRYIFFWRCPMCTRQYERKYWFGKHLLSAHNITPSDCDNVLFDVFPQKKLNEAAQNHVCRFCWCICSSKANLKDHMQFYCNCKPIYQCNVCNKKFSGAGALKIHNTIHTGELQFSCDYCSKRFRTRGQVTVHHRTHTGERPFVCEVCHQSFAHRATLISHLSVHIDLKRYKCYGCNLRFARICELRTHRKDLSNTCGKVMLNTRAVGPRVRYIHGKVKFEPEPQINPYLRTEDPPEVLTEIQNRQNDADAVMLAEMYARAAQKAEFSCFNF